MKKPKSSKTYNIYYHNCLLKQYKHRLQAWIYCLMNGYVWVGRGIKILDRNCKIVEVEDV